MFALRFIGTDKLATFEISSNADGEFCCANEFMLSDYESAPLWVAHERETAETAANNSSEWYNANYETPSNRFVGQLEVVELMVKS